MPQEKGVLHFCCPEGSEVVYAKCKCVGKFGAFGFFAEEGAL
jgi:hypothetical protein